MTPDTSRPPQDATEATVTFHPEIPINGRLVVPDDTWTFTVPINAVTDDDGFLLEDDTAASDTLANHENAPEIARRWSELTDWCYRITIDEFNSP